MRTFVVAVMALALAAPAVRGQASTQAQQAEQRRELERKMDDLERQMRDLQREMARLTPEQRRAVARVGVAPVEQVYGRAYMGVTVTTERNPATDSVGAVLQGVSPGGPADKAGLKAGDIITTFNGEKLAGRYPAAGDYESQPGKKLVDFARELEDGDTVVVDYRRAKETHRATIVARRLGSAGFSYSFVTPNVRISAEPVIAALGGLRGGLAWSTGWLDLELVKLNPELGDYFGTTDGLLVIRAADDSALQLRGGDVILSVDGRPVASQAQLMRILRSYEAGEDVKLDIMRRKQRTTLTVKVPDRRDGMRWDWEFEQ